MSRGLVFLATSRRVRMAEAATATFGTGRSCHSMVPVRSHQVGALHQRQVQPNFVDFGVGQPNPCHLQGILSTFALSAAQAFATCDAGIAEGECYNSNLAEENPDCGAMALHPLSLQYGAKVGDRQFLQELAALLTEHYGRLARNISPDELMLTNGNSHALGFVLRCLGVTHGDTVLMDDPTYFLAAGIVRSCGATLRMVPMLADGLDVQALERTLAEEETSGSKIKVLYLAGPCHHNPTGAVTSPTRAQSLISLAARRGFFIVADEPYALMGFPSVTEQGKTSIKVYEESLTGDGHSVSCPSSRVVSLGSFSKILGPGLRLGWIHACPSLISGLFAKDPVVDSGGGFNPFVAHMVYKMLFKPAGKMSAMLSSLNRQAEVKAKALCTALSCEFREALEFSEPQGGYFLWCRFTGTLPSGEKYATDAGEFRAWLMKPDQRERFRVSFLPGQQCKAGDDGVEASRFQSHFRCSWAFYDEDELVEGVKRLRHGWEAYISEQQQL